jgi:hypothetical protein
LCAIGSVCCATTTYCRLCFSSCARALASTKVTVELCGVDPAQVAGHSFRRGGQPATLTTQLRPALLRLSTCLQLQILSTPRPVRAACVFYFAETSASPSKGSNMWTKHSRQNLLRTMVCSPREALTLSHSLRICTCIASSGPDCLHALAWRVPYVHAGCTREHGAQQTKSQLCTQHCKSGDVHVAHLVPQCAT